MAVLVSESNDHPIQSYELFKSQSIRIWILLNTHDSRDGTTPLWEECLKRFCEFLIPQTIESNMMMGDKTKYYQHMTQVEPHPYKH